MAQLGRPGLSASQKAEAWQQWKIGQSLSDIGRALGKHTGSIHRMVSSHSGIIPAPRQRYGAPRITQTLHQEGLTSSANRIARRMRILNLQAIQAKKFNVTTDSKHSRPVTPDLLEQDFGAAAPNQKWTTDISYVWTDEGWLNLGVVLDLFSRAIVGWSMNRQMTPHLGCDALTMAVFRRHFPKGTILHSDPG